MNLKKIWNNRIFRTFVQTALASFAYYLIDLKFNVTNKEIFILIITALATAGSKIMPLFDEEGK